MSGPIPKFLPGEMYTTRDGRTAHNLQQHESQSVSGMIEDMPAGVQGFIWDAVYGQLLEVRFLGGTVKKVEQWPQALDLMVTIGDKSMDFQNLLEPDIHVSDTVPRDTAFMINGGEVVGKLQLEDPFQSHTSVTIAGRDIALPNGMNDAQALMVALEVAFNEIDALEARLAAVEQAPAVQSDL